MKSLTKALLAAGVVAVAGLANADAVYQPAMTSTTTTYTTTMGAGPMVMGRAANTAPQRASSDFRWCNPSTSNPHFSCTYLPGP